MARREGGETLKGYGFKVAMEFPVEAVGGVGTRGGEGFIEGVGDGRFGVKGFITKLDGCWVVGTLCVLPWTL